MYKISVPQISMGSESRKQVIIPITKKNIIALNRREKKALGDVRAVFTSSAVGCNRYMKTAVTTGNLMILKRNCFIVVSLNCYSIKSFAKL